MHLSNRNVQLWLARIAAILRLKQCGAKYVVDILGFSIVQIPSGDRIALLCLENVDEWQPMDARIGSLRERYDDILPDIFVQALTWCGDIASALRECHAAGVAHGDLYPTEVLLPSHGHGARASQNVLKLDGFGHAYLSGCTCIYEPDHSYTIQWSAPELLLDDSAPATSESDVYSWACIVYFVFTGQSPFERWADNHAKGMQAVCDGWRPNLSAISPALAWNHVQREAFLDLVTQAWDANPRKRPTAAQIATRMAELVKMCETLPPAWSWTVPPTVLKAYAQAFEKADEDSIGFIDGAELMDIFDGTELPRQTAKRILQLADVDKDGKLSKVEHAIAMHLVTAKQQQSMDWSCQVLCLGSSLIISMAIPPARHR